jgi:hypothetical protein
MIPVVQAVITLTIWCVISATQDGNSLEFIVSTVVPEAVVAVALTIRPIPISPPQMKLKLLLD